MLTRAARGVVVAVVVPLLVGCQGGAPTPSPSMTVWPYGPPPSSLTASASVSVTPSRTPSVTPSPTPSVASTVSPEAEQLVREFFDEREALYRSGVVTPRLKTLVAGDAMTQLDLLIEKFQGGFRRYVSGTMTVAWARAARAESLPGDEAVVEICTSTEGVVEYQNGVRGNKLQSAEELFHIRTFDGLLKIASVAWRDVKSC